MKYILATTLALALLSSCNGNHFKKKVEIKNNRLTLTVDVKSDDQVVDYKHSFDITGMTKKEQENLVQNIYDSLGVK